MIPELKEVNGKLEKWMKKGKYFVRTFDKLIETEGYIDNESGIAYSDDNTLIWNDSKWNATDINTGLKIETAGTFEALYNKLESMKNVITERKQSRDYKQWERQFKMILDGTLGEIIPIEQEYI